jgi:hypothetical protein
LWAFSAALCGSDAVGRACLRTTLSFSVPALVLGERPLRTGFWFYLGALSAMVAIGVVAAIVLGSAAASHTSTPKTWVAVVDVIAGALLVVYVARVDLSILRTTAREHKGCLGVYASVNTPGVARVGDTVALLH